MKLKDELLYLVLFGPDYGESIVLRIPPDAEGGAASWIVIDSLERADDDGTWRPALELLGATNHWAAVVLTHPHDDHAAGMNALLGHSGTGPIGCTHLYVEPPEDWSKSDDAERLLRKGAVEHALAAIQDRWERESSSRWELRAGSSREIGDARLEVLFPDDATLEKYRSRAPHDPNRLASPVLVEWKHARLLLGADLIATDWNKLIKLPALRHLTFPIEPHAYKVAHHGSENAIAPKAVGHRTGATWLLTPFCRGPGLPSYADGGGVQRLLAITDALHVTRCPALERASSGRSVWRLTRQEIQANISRKKLAKGLVIDQHGGTKPRDAWIAAGFDASGNLADLQHGPSSVVVTEGPSPPGRASGPAKPRPHKARAPHKRRKSSQGR